MKKYALLTLVALVMVAAACSPTGGQEPAVTAPTTTHGACASMTPTLVRRSR